MKTIDRFDLPTNHPFANPTVRVGVSDGWVLLDSPSGVDLLHLTPAHARRLARALNRGSREAEAEGDGAL
jgi:hypothetical protein